MHVRVFFIRNHFIRILRVERHNLKDLVVLKAKFVRNFSISNTFMTANNRKKEADSIRCSQICMKLCVIHVASVS